MTRVSLRAAIDEVGPFRLYRSIVARYCWAAVPLFRSGATNADLR